MFSGIIADVGRITNTADREGGLRLTIDTNALGLEDVLLGDSIAVNGVCLTVIHLDGYAFTVDVSRETLDCTVGLDSLGVAVNLEKALRLSDRHVDGVGDVLDFDDLGESWKLTIRAPQALAKFIAPKGSITVNGVSLTINQVNGSEFALNLIPHTLQMTNLKDLVTGSRVNLEVDLIARYVERMLSAQRQ
jgi:riboflavin synthase